MKHSPSEVHSSSAVQEIPPPHPHFMEPEGSLPCLQSPDGSCWRYSAAPQSVTTVAQCFNTRHPAGMQIKKTYLLLLITQNQHLVFKRVCRLQVSAHMGHLISFLLSPSLSYVPVHSRCRGVWFHFITLNYTPQSVGLLWTRDRPVAETSTWQHKHCTRQTSMSPVGFEATIPASARPQTYAKDRATTGIGFPSKCISDK
jgi:hypothetical protein